MPLLAEKTKKTDRFLGGDNASLFNNATIVLMVGQSAGRSSTGVLPTNVSHALPKNRSLKISKPEFSLGWSLVSWLLIVSKASSCRRCSLGSTVL